VVHVVKVCVVCVFVPVDLTQLICCVEMEEKSALYTFPNLRNFRVAVLRDFRRVFAHVAPVFLDRGIANIETKVGHRNTKNEL